MKAATRPIMRYHGGKRRTEVLWFNEAATSAKRPLFASLSRVTATEHEDRAL